MTPVRYVSRLRWDRGLMPGDVEVPQIAGQPIAVDVPEGAVRIREWPNRLGVLERGNPHDTVLWHADLTADEPDGVWTPSADIPDASELQERTRWFQKLLKRLEQVPGTMAYVTPSAPCGVLLTSGYDDHRLDGIEATIRREIEPLHRILPEFPGGLQLRFTDIGWDRAEEYAVTLEELLREDG